MEMVKNSGTNFADVAGIDQVLLERFLACKEHGLDTYLGPADC
jgi:hypothetical protein